MKNLIANRYKVLQPLGEGGMGIVWLVEDKLRQQKAALKQVLMWDDDQRLAITREFRTLSTLRHPNIVSVIEYGSHENQPYFTMEYLPDAQPFHKKENISITHVIQILQALDYLHRRGILHGDLKPANVLITGDGVAKVLDFGLARDMSSHPEQPGIAGTLKYLAPELLNGHSPTIGSDLWAVGIMLAEMLTGDAPFKATAPSELITTIIQNAPNLSGLSEAFLPVVSRLLSKDQSQRYPNALEVVRDLCTAAMIEIPIESREQRESFLQAARFVGRDAEYQTLVAALNTTVTGSSQVWLIGGEAGAGKSRLLDEIRTWSLVNGFVVLQGQAVEGGGLPYQLWREPARRLALGAPMSDLTASVLKQIVPDIGNLLECEVTDIPVLEPKANRDRLMAALLERLKSLNTPLLLILEDLHWASESLELLKLMLPHLEKMPVMIIGSYRNDEKPTLSDELPGANLITLQRLTSEAVAALSTSMLGAERATPQLIARLSQETEGNALFMVEVVRALAEEAGSLYRITHDSLPNRILAGGMAAVLRRRLARVPAWALDTLQLAAVIGRVINQAVLEAAGSIDLERWLQACAEAVVLEPYSGEWRFSHDRLREVLLQELPNLASLHEKAALAIEAVYPDNLNYAESLAQHWQMAGNAEKEVHFILKAAEQLVNISGHYGRAETLLQRGRELALPQTYAELDMWLGTAAEKQAQFEAAINFYERGLAANPATEVLASLYNRIASANFRSGHYAEAMNYARQSMAIAEGLGDLRNIGMSYHLMGTITVSHGNYALAHTYLTDSLRLRNEIKDYQGIPMTLNNLGVVAQSQGDDTAALTYFEESLRILRQNGDRRSIGMSLNNLGRIAAGRGNYETARTYQEDALRIFQELGDRQGVARSLALLGTVALYLGDYPVAGTYYQDSLNIRREIGDLEGIATCLESLGCVAFAQQDYAAARRYSEESIVLCREIDDQEMLVYATSDLTMALVQLGEPAQETLLDALRTARKIDAVPFMLLVLLAAAYWSAEDAATWIGLLNAQASAEITHDIRLKRLTGKVRSELGEEAFNQAVERGKTLDVRVVTDELLQRLTG